MGDIIIIAVILGFMFWGNKCGFIKMLIGLLSTVASIILSLFLYGPISDFIINSEFGNKLTELIKVTINNNIASGKTNTLGSILLNEGHTIESVAAMVSNAIGFIIAIIAVKILISVLIKIINIASYIPGVKQLNGLLGSLAGLLGGIVFCYIALGLLFAISPSGSFEGITDMMETSKITKMLCENNIIINLMTAK